MTTLIAMLMLAQTPVYVTTTSSLTWDLPTVWDDGSPMPITEIGGHEVCLSATTVDMNAGGTALVTVYSTLPPAALGPLIAGRPPGEYRLWVRCEDTEGDWSVWSQPLLITTVPPPIAPGPPTNLRISYHYTPDLRAIIQRRYYALT